LNNNRRAIFYLQKEEMNQTIMIAIIMILTVVLIVALLMYKSKQASQKISRMLTDELTRVAVDSSLNIDKQELFRNRVIGMDTQKMKLVYVQREGTGCEYDLVDIKHLDSCEVMKTGSNLNTHPSKGMNEHVTAIYLRLKLKTDITLDTCFYSEIEDGGFEKQPAIQKALSWQTMLIDLKNKTKPALLTS
jgi:hypothetical protein